MSSSDPKRLRNEHRAESGIGQAIERAAEEAGNRVVRALTGPPLTDAEKEILAHSKHEQAHLYTTVLVHDLQTGEFEQYRIVREGEGDLNKGEVSLSSPLGRAVLMEYPGAVVAAKTPAGQRLYRILRVQP